MASVSRRQFLKRAGASAFGLGLLACSRPTPEPEAGADAPMMMSPEPVEPIIVRATAPAPPLTNALPPSPGPRRLIVIQLSGGDDGLNAVVPFGDGLYYQLRPSLAIAADQVLPLDDRVGLHPSLQGFKRLWDQGKLAVVQGVGYPNPNRSHFRSMDIWHTGSLEASVEHGWLGSFMAQAQQAELGPFQSVALGTSVPRALQHTQASPATLLDAATFNLQTDRRLPALREGLVQAWGELNASASWGFPALQIVAGGWVATARGVEQLRTIGEGYRPSGQYPQGPFGRALLQVASLSAADLGTRVLYASIGGWDTHANQRTTHANLLTQLGDGLSALQHDLEQSGQAHRTLILVFSEFGRRVKENGSNGSDHGAAGPVFLLGSSVKGGLYGEYPHLGNLLEGDLAPTTDFRQVYATVLEDWLGISARSVLGAPFDRLGIVA